MSGLMFPKPGPKKKKRRHHPASIMQRKEDGYCYLCALLEDNWKPCRYREGHHIFFSKKLRPMSEEYGLKVYLCRRHHREEPEAVHQNWRNRRILEAQGQQAFEEIYGHEKFMKVFGQNYIFEESKDEKEKEHEGASCFEAGR